MSLIEKIIKIQHELRAPKNQYNSFGRYNYRSQEDVLEALKPLLYKEGLLQTITDSVRLIGNRYYIEATVTVSFESDSIQVSALAREADQKKGMDESQISGTASSYARKYALNGMWLIDDAKDADTDEARMISDSAKPSQPQAKKQPENDNRKWLNEGTEDWLNAEQKIRAGAVTVKDLFTHYKVSKQAQAYFSDLAENP
jgi:hypothetical protein